MRRKRYDRIAPLYDILQSPMDGAIRSWRERLWSRIQDGKVLEADVGTGRNFPHYPEGTEVTAVDLSPRMLARARGRAARMGPGVDLREMDVQHLAFPADSFDFAVASFLFCSVSDPVKGLTELGRVVVAGGQILLLEHMRPRGHFLGRIFDLLSPVTSRLFGFNLNRRTLQNLRRAGLTLERAEDLDRWGIVKLVVARSVKEVGMRDRTEKPVGAFILSLLAGIWMIGSGIVMYGWVGNTSWMWGHGMMGGTSGGLVSLGPG